jgi:phage terminase large subunit-like protein
MDTTILIEDDIIELEKSICEDSYFEFFQTAFNILEPETPLVVNWHQEYICDVLQKEVERIIRKEPKKYDVIIINVPPRTLKTYLVSKLLNAWAWTVGPHLRFLTSAYASQLATSHALDTRRLIRSDWYQQKWGNNFQIMADKDTQGRFDNTQSGMRYAVGFSGATGEGGDIISTDDPLNPEMANSKAERDSANRFWDLTFFSRLNNPNVGTRFIVMQRLHDKDLTAHVMNNTGLEILHISLPALKNSKVYPIELAEKYTDKYLFPEWLSESVLEGFKKGLGPYGFAGQYMQNPTPDGGGKIKKGWFKTIERRKLPTNLVKYYYTDPSEGKNQDADEMATGCWSIYEGSIYIWGMLSSITQFADYIGMYTDLTRTNYKKRLYDNFVDLYGSTMETAHYVEDKSLGSAYTSYMNKYTPYHAIADNPGSASKESRAYAAIPTIAAGKVVLVVTGNPVYDEWIEPFLEQVAAFPKGDEDGQVDVLSSIVRKSNIDPLQSERSTEEVEVEGEMKNVDDYIEENELTF